MRQANGSEGADVAAVGIICLASLVFYFRKQARHWLIPAPGDNEALPSSSKRK
jgi:hypothetical protein